jgi:hypothetical protein
LIEELTTLFSRRGSRIHDFNLSTRSDSPCLVNSNRFIDDELSYDISIMQTESEMLTSRLNNDQLHAFKTITETVLANKAGFYFVLDYGGTGKTYLWNSIITFLCSRKQIVLSVASSGVASLLLRGGRTTHSRFKIPCELEETTVCDIKRGTMLSKLVQVASLIIWDEALMTHRFAFEALDRSFRDILASSSPMAKDLPFGGKVGVLGGDLRQTLLVIEGGNHSQIVNSAIINSSLWSHVHILHLTQNMRLLMPSLSQEERQELSQFSKWMLDVGEGKIDATSQEGEDEQTWIKIPQELLLMPHGDKIACIVHTIYEKLNGNYMRLEYLKSRAILTPTNDIVDSINEYIVSLNPRDAKEYLSCDKVIKAPNTHESYGLLYPIEFLNTLNGNNFPQHRIILKKGTQVMLLRNLNQSEGLCNGTRLLITSLCDKVIEGQIMTDI